jgi:hypothetical protein
MTSSTVIQNFNKYVKVNTMTSFFFGAGVCFVLEEKKYSHIPFVIFCPVVYGGYNIFKNRHIFISEKITNTTTTNNDEIIKKVYKKGI